MKKILKRLSSLDPLNRFCVVVSFLGVFFLFLLDPSAFAGCVSFLYLTERCFDINLLSPDKDGD